MYLDLFILIDCFRAIRKGFEDMSFHYFFSRKVCLAFSSEAYIFFPGGFGTLDEFFEIITLVQTRKIRQIPIVLVGHDYWKTLIDFFKDTLIKEGKIADIDMNIFVVTDNENEILEKIKLTPVKI